MNAKKLLIKLGKEILKEAAKELGVYSYIKQKIKSKLFSKINLITTSSHYNSFSEWLIKNHKNKFNSIAIKSYVNIGEEVNAYANIIPQEINLFTTFKKIPILVIKNESSSKKKNEENLFGLSIYALKKDESKLVNALTDLVVEYSTIDEDYGLDCYINLLNHDSKGLWQIKRECWAPKNLDNVIVDHKVKKDISEDLENWKTQSEFYEELGLCFNRTYLQYGPPRTGKTSMAYALARRYDFYSVYVLNMANFKNEDAFFKAISHNNINNSMIVIEELHKCYENDKALPGINVSFATFLNFLNGNYELENVIIMINTNSIKTVDKAILGAGRVDAHFFYGYPDKNLIEEFVQKFFKDDSLTINSYNADYSMADVQELCKRNYQNPTEAITSIENGNPLWEFKDFEYQNK